MYVANTGSNNVSVIRPSDNTVVATVTVGTSPFGVAYSPSNDRVYVANSSSGNVSVIRPSDNTVVATVTVGTTPRYVAYSPSNDRVYVANNGSNNVSVIRPSDNTVVSTVTVGASPYGIAYSPSNDRVYVANYGSNNVSVIYPSITPSPTTLAGFGITDTLSSRQVYTTYDSGQITCPSTTTVVVSTNLQINQIAHICFNWDFVFSSTGVNYTYVHLNPLSSSTGSYVWHTQNIYSTIRTPQIYTVQACRDFYATAAGKLDVGFAYAYSGSATENYCEIMYTLEVY